MIKIKTEKDLKNVLRLVVENAKSMLNEKTINMEDPYQKFLKNQSGLLEEEESEEENVESDDAEKGDQEKSSKEKPSKEKTSPSTEDEDEEPDNPAMEKALNYGAFDSTKEVTYEDIKDAINTMRAGRSLKDADIKDALKSYYERLDVDERGVLLLFLKELTKILTGAIEGDEAQDPSDPKSYFDITKREKESPESGNDLAKPSQKVTQKPRGQQAQTSVKGEEDTSPPIKVNESQDYSILLKKVKNLMKS